MVKITNPFSGAVFSYTGAYNMSGDFRAADKKITTLNCSITAEGGEYIGSASVNQNGDKRQVNVNVPFDYLVSASQDVAAMLAEIEEKFNK